MKQPLLFIVLFITLLLTPFKDSIAQIEFNDSTDSIIMPIGLVSFDVYCNGNNNAIQWRTVSETNNDYFTLERSIDGQNWQTLESIDATANSSVARDYSFIDSKLPIANIYYYRLKQTDYNGSSEYLETISIARCTNNTTEKTLAVYPNPSSGKFNLVFSEDWSTVQSIEVFNQYGKLVNYTANESNSIDLTGEARGIYFIRLNQGNNVITQTITIE